MEGEEMTGRVYENIKWSLPFLLVMGFATWISLHVHDLGWRIIKDIPSVAQPPLGPDYAMGVLWWSVFAIGILLVAGEDSRRMLLLAWIAKFFVVLVAMLFYENHYGLDAYAYFDLALTGKHWMYPGLDFREDMIPSLRLIVADGAGLGFDNTARFMLCIASITGPFYHAMKIFCAFLGLMGIWLFYRAAIVALGRPHPSLFYFLAFFPSLLFWSSILGKDPIQFFFLGLYAYGSAVWLVQDRLSALGFVGAGIFGAYLLRPWIGLMAAGSLFLATLLGRRRAWQVGLALAASGPILYFFWDQVGLLSGGSFIESPDMLLEFFHHRAESFAGETQQGGSGDELPDLTSEGTIQAALPWAVFTGLFRPLPFDITNPVTALAALENTVVLLLALAALYRFRLAYIRDSLVIWPIAFSLMWAVVYGFIVMANFGSGARYKLQTWPFFLLLLLLLTHKDGRALLESRRSGRTSPGGHMDQTDPSNPAGVPHL